MKTILLTGASGFIARNLAKKFKKEDYRVIGISRRRTENPDFNRIYISYLGQPIEQILNEEKIDVIVHCANHTQDNEFNTNVDGTTLWMKEALSKEVKLQIFLSSLSAKENAISAYGKAKFRLEQIFLEADQIVLRLGVVIGNGGMFANIKKSIQKMPFLPLLDNGSQRVYILGIDFLCKVILDCIKNDGHNFRGKTLSIQQPKFYTLKQLMLEIKKQYNYFCIFIPIPSIIILSIFDILEKLPLLKLNIRSSNIKGLRQSRYESFSSDFKNFGYQEESLCSLIKKVFESTNR